MLQPIRVKLCRNSWKKKRLLNTHSPYSPDLSPCDFFLFPKLKKMLSGRRYSSRNGVESAVYQCLEGIPRADYSAAFQRAIFWRVELNEIKFQCFVYFLYIYSQNLLNTPHVTVLNMLVLMLQFIQIFKWSTLLLIY